MDPATFISGRGGILELIKAGIEMPPGILIFEDPPTHTIHRRLLSRMFTPEAGRRARAEDPRRSAPAASTRYVGTGSFDFIADLGAQMPMRTIGMLLGIPEADQEAIRDQTDANLRTKAGEPMEVDAEELRQRRAVRRLHRLAGRPPVRRHHDRAPPGRVRGRDRHRPPPHPAGDPHLPQRRRRRRQRDHGPADRLGRQGPRRPPRPAARAGRGPVAHPRRHRGAAPLRDRRRRTSAATSPATSRSTARRSRRAAPCCS